MNIVNSDCDSHLATFYLAASMFEAFFMIVFCTYKLHEIIGYACFLPWLFVLGK